MNVRSQRLGIVARSWMIIVILWQSSVFDPLNAGFQIFFFIRLEIRIATKGVAINATNRKFYRFNFPPEILPRVEKKDGGVGGARI